MKSTCLPTVERYSAVKRIDRSHAWGGGGGFAPETTVLVKRPSSPHGVSCRRGPKCKYSKEQNRSQLMGGGRQIRTDRRSQEPSRVGGEGAKQEELRCLPSLWNEGNVIALHCKLIKVKALRKAVKN